MLKLPTKIKGIDPRASHRHHLPSANERKCNKLRGINPFDVCDLENCESFAFPLHSLSSTINKTGFTLLEVMMAMTILIIGILGLVKIAPLALQINATATQNTVAINLAQAKIEELFYLDYDNINIGTIEPKARLSTDSSNPFYQYQRQTVVEYVDGDLNSSVTETGLKKATVTVFFNSPILHIEKSKDVIIIIADK